MLDRWRSGRPTLSPEDSAELESRLGHPRWIRRLPSSPRSEFWLAEFYGSPAVVKHVLGGPGERARSVGLGASEGLSASVGLGAPPQERYGREVTALRLAARVHPAVVPNVMAALPVPRLLVLERLNDRRPPAGWTRPWAVALARLHASTGPADTGSLPAWRPPGSTEARAFLELAVRLAGSVPSSVPAELEQLLGRLRESGGHALLHGRPCPGKARYEAGAARFLDLEAAAVGGGLVELACLRVGFPACGGPTGMSEAELLAAETAYRQAYRSAAGTDPAGDLTDACAGWLLSGDPPGRRGLAHRLTAVAGLCAERPDLGGLGRLCLAMRAGMDGRRPDRARSVRA